MVLINKTIVGVAIGVASSFFVGYCIYFDKKRRNDPEYKKKVAERRRLQKKITTYDLTSSKIPNFNNQEEVQKYFLQQISQGETLLGQKDFEKGAEHLANAIIVSSQPVRLIQNLRKSLSAEVFEMLIVKLQAFVNCPGGFEYKNLSADKDDSSSIIDEDSNELALR